MLWLQLCLNCLLFNRLLCDLLLVRLNVTWIESIYIEVLALLLLQGLCILHLLSKALCESLLRDPPPNIHTLFSCVVKYQFVLVILCQVSVV